MPNPLQPFVLSTHAVAVYENIERHLGLEPVIFAAMNKIADSRGFVFDLPSSPAEYQQKHEELKLSLSRYWNSPNREGLLFDLVEEMLAQLIDQDIQAERLRNLVVLDTNKNFKIRLSKNGAWFVEWELENPEDSQDKRNIVAVVHKSDWGDVVPWTIIQYLDSSFLLFRQKSYATALALMSIAVEATLRDALHFKGYGHFPGESDVDIYDFAKAQVNISGSDYILSFIDSTSKSASDLGASAGGVLPLEIKIRRDGNTTRENLLVRAPQFLIDHWSVNKVVQRGQSRNIGGLREALKIARETEKIIATNDLFTDVDEVLQAIRNKLIHLSNDSLNEELKQLSKVLKKKVTLRDFLSQPKYVFDYVIDIPRFINDQYIKLWQNNNHLPPPTP